MIIETISRKKIFLKAPDIDQVIIELLEIFFLNYGDDPDFPENRRLLGYGHGRHEKLAKRRSTFVTVALPTRAVDDSTIITTNKNNQNIHKYREKPLHSTNDFTKQFPNMLDINDNHHTTTTDTRNQLLFQKTFPVPNSATSKSHDTYTHNNGNRVYNGDYN